MRIERISIKDYKVFEGKSTITLPEDGKPAVFIGVNGSGKTSVLTAIIGCYWEYYHRIMRKSKIPYSDFFSEGDINIDADESCEVTLSVMTNSSEKNISFGFKLNRTAGKLYNAINGNEVKELVSTIRGDVGFYKAQSSVPILVFYPVERMVLSPSLKPGSKNEKKENQFDAYQKAFESSIDFNDFFEWFRRREDIENEIRLNEDQEFTDLKLESVRKAILTFLEGFTRIRVKRVGTIALVLEKNSKEFEVNQLSHGEKAIITLVGDLARRLVTANPGGFKPLRGSGIVLIDELGLHLHPKWQKTVLEKLQSTFPNIQFICTTHSPLIINHVHSSSVYLLEEGKCTSLADKLPSFNSYGADIEDILKVVQNSGRILPPEIFTQLDRLFEVIREDNLQEARIMVESLKAQTDPNQPELKKAESQIRYKELLKD